jgi:hypothetical protein
MTLTSNAHGAEQLFPIGLLIILASWELSHGYLILGVLGALTLWQFILLVRADKRHVISERSLTICIRGFVLWVLLMGTAAMRVLAYEAMFLAGPVLCIGGLPLFYYGMYIFTGGFES